MASISAIGSKGHHKFTLTVTEASTSKANNTSTVSYSLNLKPIVSGYDWAQYTNASRTVSYTVTINGTAYKGTVPAYDGKSTVTLKSGTQTVTHNTDGAKTISFSFVVNDTTGATYTSGNASANGSLKLTTFEIEKPVSGAAPIIEAHIEDTNDKTIELTGDSSVLIRYCSDAKVTMTVTPQQGATINESSLIIRNGNQSGSGYSYTFENAESNTFIFSAKDSKGYQARKEVYVDMIPYVKLTCNMDNSRPDTNGEMTLSCSGNFFNGSFGEYDNTLSVTYHYISTDGKEKDEGDMTVIINPDNTYTASVYLGDLSYKKNYTFTIYAEDELSRVTSKESGVKSKPGFHWGKDDFTFEVPVTFNGDVCFNGDVDGDFTDNSNSVDTDYGYWIPRFSNYNAVETYRTQEGWYQRLGNVITIGWHLKATIEPGCRGKELKIVCDEDYFSLPEPSVSAFGGGVAFNIRTENDFIFEGWSIAYDDDDESDTYRMTVITARLQGCEKASTDELKISSTCYYPDVSEGATTDEKTVTVAGTICYMTEE